MDTNQNTNQVVRTQQRPLHQLRRGWRYHGMLLGLWMLLTLGTIQSVSAQDAPQVPQAEQNYVFMPLTVKQNGVSTATPTPTPTPTPTETPTPEPPVAGGLFPNRDVKTASASTATDSAGGYHAAYIYYLPDVEENPAIYAFCAGDACNDLANWREVKLLDNSIEVQLALTAKGEPRLLIVTNSVVYDGGKDYHYASCNSGCTAVANWKTTLVYTSWGTSIYVNNDDRAPQRSFALDPQGNPRFIYQDRNYLYSEPDHYGAFYAFCDSGCHNAANWSQTEVGRFIGYDAEIFELPSLAFTKDGRPRIVSLVFALNDDGSEAPNGLYYYACDSGCGQTASWKREFLIPTGFGSFPLPSWDIELDSQDRPRVVIFTGNELEPETVENRLLYFWCNQGCLNADNWEFHNVGLAREDGESPDLELDAQDRPRIAVLDDLGELAYVWCDVNCQSDAGVWESIKVETEAELRAEFPRAIPFNCDSDLWNGLAPVLSLDPSGNPRIAYDLSVDARCLYDDPDDGQPPYFRFMPVWHTVRVVYFEQP